MKSHVGSLPRPLILQLPLLLVVVVTISITSCNIVAIHGAKNTVVIAPYLSSSSSLLSEVRIAGGEDAASNLFSTNNKTARNRHRRALRDSSATRSNISRGAKQGRPTAVTSSSRAMIDDEAVTTATTQLPPKPLAAPINDSKFLYDPKAAKSNGTNTATAASKAAKIAKSAKTKSSKSTTLPGLDDETSAGNSVPGDESGVGVYDSESGGDGASGSQQPQTDLDDQTDGTGDGGTTNTSLGENGMEVEYLDGDSQPIMENEEFDVVDGSDRQQGDMVEDGSSFEGQNADTIDGSEQQSDTVDGTVGQTTDVVDGTAGQTDIVDGTSEGQQTTDMVDNSQGQEDGNENSSNGQQIDKAVTDSNKSSTVSSTKLSAASATFMALGLAALVTLALLFVIVVKRRRSESYNEFDNDDEHDLHDKKTDIDAASLTSSPNKTKKRAYVVGEEGSVYTSATHDTRFIHASYESGNDNNDDLQVNVHHCTSALCPICNGRGPIFVNALDNESITAGAVDTSFENSYRQSRSYEYKLGEEVSIPSFRNPAAEMMERPYIVDNTVAF